MVKAKRRDYILNKSKIGYEVFSERALAFIRYRQHMIFPQNWEIKLERNEEKIKQIFFLTKLNCQVNFIYPIHSSKEETISSDVKNK